MFRVFFGKIRTAIFVLSNNQNQKVMKYGDFKKSILAASTQEEIAAIIQVAAKESMEASQFGGFKKEWNLEQHVTEETRQAKYILESRNDIPNTGRFGYAGTARDYARGFDGIE